VIAALTLSAMLPMAGALCAGECNRAAQHQTSSTAPTCHEAATSASARLVSGKPDRCIPFVLRDVATRERVVAPPGSDPVVDLVTATREARVVAHPLVDAKRPVFERTLPPGTLVPLRI
jgi:hypothetical protein